MQASAALGCRQSPAPLSRRLAELASSLVRFHLRRLLNAPPVSYSTEDALRRVGATPTRAEDSRSRVHALVRLAAEDEKADERADFE